MFKKKVDALHSGGYIKFSALTIKKRCNFSTFCRIFNHGRLKKRII